jgi:tetratricopeptide (TPR) repeat protein
MMEVKAEDRLHQIRRWWKYGLALGLALILATVLVFPWGASAYYVERAGRRLAAIQPAGAATVRAAQRELRQALAWHAENAHAYWLLAGNYKQQRDWSAAAEALVRYVSLRPGNPQGYWELSMACEQVAATELIRIVGQPCGSDEKSRQAALSLLWQKAGQSAADFVRAGDRSSRSEDWSQAIAFYQRAQVLDPESATAWNGLAEVHRARGEKEEALEAYAHVMSLSSDPSLAASAYSQRGRILADAGRWAEASEELAQAVVLVADKGQYHLDYGWYLYRAGSPIPEARAALTKAAEMLPKSPWPHLYLANLDFAEKDYASVLAHAQMGIKANPKQVWGWIWQSRALRHLGRQGEAEESARHAVELAPDNAAARAELGQVLVEVGSPDEAIKEWEQAVALAPDSVWYHLSLGGAYRANGQTPRAAEAYQRVLELAPGNAAAKKALQDLGY